MKKLLIIAALLSSSAAFAHCPDQVTCEMKAIDSTIAAATVNQEAIDKVKPMRAEGQKLYEEGRVQEALKVLKEARKILKDAKSS